MDASLTSTPDLQQVIDDLLSRSDEFYPAYAGLR